MNIRNCVTPHSYVIPLPFVEDFMRHALRSPMFRDSMSDIYTNNLGGNVKVDQVTWLLDMMVGIYNTKPIAMQNHEGFTLEAYHSFVLEGVSQTMVLTDTNAVEIESLSDIVYWGFKTMPILDTLTMIKWGPNQSGVFKVADNPPWEISELGRLI